MADVEKWYEQPLPDWMIPEEDTSAKTIRRYRQGRIDMCSICEMLVKTIRQVDRQMTTMRERIVALEARLEREP